MRGGHTAASQTPWSHLAKSWRERRAALLGSTARCTRGGLGSNRSHSPTATGTELWQQPERAWRPALRQPSSPPGPWPRAPWAQGPASEPDPPPQRAPGDTAHVRPEWLAAFVGLFCSRGSLTAGCAEPCSRVQRTAQPTPRGPSQRLSTHRPRAAASGAHPRAPGAEGGVEWVGTVLESRVRRTGTVGVPRGCGAGLPGSGQSPSSSSRSQSHFLGKC